MRGEGASDVGIRPAEPAVGGAVAADGNVTVAGAGPGAPGGTDAPPGARRAVHAASGSRLGASHPRREGPVDLRLVPPALAAWATAAVMLDASPQLVGGLALGCVLVAGVLLGGWGSRARRGRVSVGAGVPLPPDGGRGRAPVRGERLSERPGGRAPNMPRGRAPGSAQGRPPGPAPSRAAGARHGWSRTGGAAVLLCAAAAGVSAGLHGADLRRGPVPVLAREYATVTAEVELTSDPRLARPKVTGNRMTTDSVLINGEVRSIATGGPDMTGGTAGVAGVATRAPVLVIVDVGERKSEGTGTGGGGPADAGRGVRQAWLGLLPSTRVRVTGRLAPALTGGDRIAAVLRLRDRAGRPVPSVVRQPSAAQRIAGRLRAGLREATDGLPADARALLPGLVVGDTSRITPELDEAFKETDLAHTLAVSGSNLTIMLALLLGPPGLAQQVERRGLAPRLGIPLRTTALLGGVLTLGFVVVCRPDPSVLRAAACGAVVLLALATGRRRSLIPALATAVLLLVLYDPWLARSYGFLLSVLATGALLTLAPRWSAALRGRGVPPRLAEALAAAGAAQALCAPVVAVLSARVSLVAVPCNLLVEFAVAPATVLGFATLATAPWALPVAKALAWCASWPVEWIAGVARTGAALPGAGVDWPGSWGGALLLALATLVAVLVGRRLLRRPWLCAACAALLLLAVVRPPPLTRLLTGWPPPGWRLAMCG